MDTTPISLARGRHPGDRPDQDHDVRHPYVRPVHSPTGALPVPFGHLPDSDDQPTIPPRGNGGSAELKIIREAPSAVGNG